LLFEASLSFFLVFSKFSSFRTILVHNHCLLTLSICVDTNDALHFYSHDNAATSGGKLNISTEQKINDYKAFDEKKKTFFADKKYIQSAMMQSWNKFCFVGGIVEFSAKLPGDPRTGGLWPARESSSPFA
jgi:beta-glucanase (GH16 family)